MKIRLKQDIPVEKKHGMTEGREFEVPDAERVRVQRRHELLQVPGDAGEKVSLQQHEYEEVQDENG